MYQQSSSTIALYAAAILSLVPPQALAQEGGAGIASNRALLVGMVIDSINGGPLAGATVMLDGTPLVAIADAEGRFRIDSIPPGSYRVGVFHPVLDSLGMSIGSPAMRFGPDSVREVVLGTPSAQTLIAQWCPPATRRLGPAVLVGRVVDPETSAPIARARVTLVWEETEIDVATVTRRRVPRVRAAISDETGRFALCGMGADTRGTLQAERGRDKTSELPVAMDGRTFVVQTVLLGRAVMASGVDSALGAQQTPRRAGTATVAGRVLDAAGRPVMGARVSVDGAGTSALSDSAGAFAIGRVPAGSWVVAARRVGFHPGEVTVHLLPERTERITFMLDPAATELAPVVVTKDASAGLERVGFAARQRLGMGRYLTSDQIAARRPIRTTQLLETIPGIRVVSNGRGGYSLRSTRDSNGCVSVYIDGFHSPQSSAGDLDMSLPPDQIAAVEVYSASTRPSEFTTPGQAQCAAVVFWTKTRVRQRQ